MKFILKIIVGIICIIVILNVFSTCFSLCFYSPPKPPVSYSTPSSTPQPLYTSPLVSVEKPYLTSLPTPVLPTPQFQTSTSAIASTPFISSTGGSSSLTQLYKEMQNPSANVISKNFTWKYGFNEWTWSMQIPEVIYDYYKALPRPLTANYSVYVTHPLHEKYLAQLAGELQKIGKQKGYTDFETVSLTAAFVQSLDYKFDNVTEGYDEYPRFPIETLLDQGGDCEDTAILTASLIRSLGYGVVLIVFPSSPNISGHCAVGVAGGTGMTGTYFERDGKKYYYLETTSEGWEIGEIPKEYSDRSAKLYPMVPVPILTHDWKVEVNGSNAQINVTVDNLGSAAAKDVHVIVGFDAGNNQVWGRQLSPNFDLGVNESEIATLNLLPPLGKHTRIVIQIVYDGYAVDESYSKWFDT